MKTSINFKEAKADSEVHNFRKKSFDYIRKELTPRNEYWQIQSIAERRKNIENYCKEKSGRKLQKNCNADPRSRGGNKAGYDDAGTPRPF